MEEPRSGDEVWQALLSGLFDWARDRRRFGCGFRGRSDARTVSPLSRGWARFLMRRIPTRGPLRSTTRVSQILNGFLPHAPGPCGSVNLDALRKGAGVESVGLGSWAPPPSGS